MDTLACCISKHQMRGIMTRRSRSSDGPQGATFRPWECALLVIAHRFSTIQTADRIAVLNDGHIIAAGSHNYLLSTSDYYRQLATGRLNPQLPTQPTAVES